MLAARGLIPLLLVGGRGPVAPPAGVGPTAPPLPGLPPFSRTGGWPPFPHPLPYRMHLCTACSGSICEHVTTGRRGRGEREPAPGSVPFMTYAYGTPADVPSVRAPPPCPLPARG